MKVLFIAFCTTLVLSGCVLRMSSDQELNCNNTRPIEFKIRNNKIKLSMYLIACYDSVGDTVNYELYMQNYSKTDTFIASFFIPSLHTHLKCSEPDTISFLHEFVGGHSYRFNPIGYNFRWVGLNPSLLLPGERRVFIAKLGKDHICTLEYLVFSYKYNDGYSLFISRTENGKTNFSLLQLSEIGIR